MNTGFRVWSKKKSAYVDEVMGYFLDPKYNDGLHEVDIWTGAYDYAGKKIFVNDVVQYEMSKTPKTKTIPNTIARACVVRYNDHSCEFILYSGFNDMIAECDKKWDEKYHYNRFDVRSPVNRLSIDRMKSWAKAVAHLPYELQTKVHFGIKVIGNTREGYTITSPNEGVPDVPKKEGGRRSRCSLCGGLTKQWIDGGFGKVGTCCMNESGKKLFGEEVSNASR